ncbi:MAG: AAA family ATPase [Elainellaceae cyanobacterium]
MGQGVRLVVMIGLPGSGKTTFARRLVPEDLLISTDAIRRELFGNEAIQGPWAQIEARVVERLMQVEARSEAAPSRYAVYDATNAVHRQRCRFLRQAHGLGFTAIYGCWLDYSLDLCLGRNRSRSKPVPDAVVERMHRCLTGAPPSLNDGFEGLLRIPQVLASLSQQDQS